MTTNEIVFGVALVVILVGFALYGGWRQWHALQIANADSTLSDEDRKHFRRQASRRLICSCLMLAMAGLLVGALSMESRANVLSDQVKEARDRGESPGLNPEERKFTEAYATIWIVLLLLLLTLIILAGFDYSATRRYGKRNYRIIQIERNAMIRDELKRFRQEQGERN